MQASWPSQTINARMPFMQNMHEVRFPNIYILSRIIYYIFPLTIIIALAIKAAQVFQRSDRFCISNVFAMHFGDIKNETFFFLLLGGIFYYFILKNLFLYG